MFGKIKRLPTEFIGKGEMKGFHFNQLERGQKCCLYQVRTDYKTIHYEVFIIKTFKVPITKELYEAYPKANSFGIWAWSINDYNKAVKKFNKIESNEFRCHN